MLGFSERCNVDEAVLGSVSGDLVDLPVVVFFFFFCCPPRKTEARLEMLKLGEINLTVTSIQMCV